MYPQADATFMANTTLPANFDVSSGLPSMSLRPDSSVRDMATTSGGESAADDVDDDDFCSVDGNNHSNGLPNHDDDDEDEDAEKSATPVVNVVARRTLRRVRGDHDHDETGGGVGVAARLCCRRERPPVHVVVVAPVRLKRVDEPDVRNDNMAGGWWRSGLEAKVIRERQMAGRRCKYYY